MFIDYPTAAGHAQHTFGPLSTNPTLQWPLTTKTYLADEFADHSVPASFLFRIVSAILAILDDSQFVCNKK